MSFFVLHTEFAAQLERANCSQLEFARLCGVTAMGVNNWCRGRRDVPKWAWVLACAIERIPADQISAEPKMTFCEVLGVPVGASLPLMRDAWKKLAKKYHPDTGGSLEAMQRINAAFDLAKQRRSPP